MGRRRAKLGSHGTRPEPVRKSVCSYSPRAAVTGCRAECFGQRPSCLLNQLPPPVCSGGCGYCFCPGRPAPLPKAPALMLCLSTSCSGLPSLCCSPLWGRSRGWAAQSRGLRVPGVVPAPQMWLGGWRRKCGGPARYTAARQGLRRGGKEGTREETPTEVGHRAQGCLPEQEEAGTTLETGVEGRAGPNWD